MEMKIKALCKVIRRHYGERYTTDEIVKIIEDEGCTYFNNENLHIEYKSFGNFLVTEQK